MEGKRGVLVEVRMSRPQALLEVDTGGGEYTEADLADVQGFGKSTPVDSAFSLREARLERGSLVALFDCEQAPTPENGECERLHRFLAGAFGPHRQPLSVTCVTLD